MNNSKWPCIFGLEFTRKDIHKRLYKQYPKYPFGAFTRAWRWEHCARINPYGSESCPYEPTDCALAYFKTAQDAMEAHTSKVGLFKALAKRRGMIRAENKPLPRDRVRTDGLEERASGLRSGARTGPDDDLLEDGTPAPSLTRPLARDESVGLRRKAAPTSIGALLRPDGEGSRPRTRRWDEGQESTDHNGQSGDPVSPPSSERLGDQPPSGDPGLHQGGQ